MRTALFAVDHDSVLLATSPIYNFVRACFRTVDWRLNLVDFRAMSTFKARSHSNFVASASSGKFFASTWTRLWQFVWHRRSSRPCAVYPALHFIWYIILNLSDEMLHVLWSLLPFELPQRSLKVLWMPLQYLTVHHPFVRSVLGYGLASTYRW